MSPSWLPAPPWSAPVSPTPGPVTARTPTPGVLARTPGPAVAQVVGQVVAPRSAPHGSAAPQDAPPRRGSPGPEILVRRGELGDIAWQVLVHEGAVVPLTEDVGLPAGVPARARHRAAALAPRVRAGEVLIGPAAVWVHLGGPPPVGVECARRRPVPHRASAAPRARAVGPAATTTGRPVLSIGGLLLPDLIGTALGLARTYPAETALPLLLRLADEGGLALDQVWQALGSCAGWRGIRQAESTLRTAMRSPTARASVPAVNDRAPAAPSPSRR